MQDTQEAGRVKNKKELFFFLIKAVNQIPVDSKYKDQAQKSLRQEKQKEQAGANEKEKKKEERTTKIQKLNTDQKKKKKPWEHRWERERHRRHRADVGENRTDRLTKSKRKTHT